MERIIVPSQSGLAVTERSSAMPRTPSGRVNDAVTGLELASATLGT